MGVANGLFAFRFTAADFSSDLQLLLSLNKVHLPNRDDKKKFSINLACST